MPGRGFGLANVVTALLVLGFVFGALPARWWVVDGGALVVAALFGVSGTALLARARHAKSLARVASAVVLALGLGLCLALLRSARWLSAAYGQATGAFVFTMAAALAFPYVVVLPAIELLWLGLGRRLGTWRNNT